MPKKPELTSEEIGQLIDQETKDVESAWILTSEAKETFMKPCPKQQRAREAVRAIMEPKKEDLVTLMPLVLKETPPVSQNFDVLKFLRARFNSINLFIYS